MFKIKNIPFVGYFNIDPPKGTNRWFLKDPTKGVHNKGRNLKDSLRKGGAAPLSTRVAR
jgi:hypothetical protein